MENAEINNIVKIMGLQYGKKYRSVDDMKSLRYGRLMIMTDQDQDGSHIKGLLINFIHHNWPDLLRLPFLEEFITPIVKVCFGCSVIFWWMRIEHAYFVSVCLTCVNKLVQKKQISVVLCTGAGGPEF